ncbi:MAG: SAM-dependent methyltransferase [Verrucomicrobiaceae bacterium]|nr:SAM-dependent methyltransferase [Verrucomicrobiaceae bacterium]
MGSSSLGKTFLSPALHERLQADRYPINEFVRRLVMPLLKPGMRVLDAGSGRLPEQHLRSELLATGAALETLDFLPGEGVDHTADVADTKLPDQSYDVILCMQVLEHVPNPQAVCAELYRMSKPGAHVMVSAPQSAWLHNLPYHFFHYTNIGMRQILEQAGFEVITLDPQGGHFTTLAVMNHYTCRVLEELAERKGNPFWFRPIRIMLRLWYGFIMKSFYLWLDRIFFWEDNTQGWNALCRRKM